MTFQYETEVDGFSFILVSFGYQPDATEYEAKSAYVMMDVNNFPDLDDRDRFLDAFLEACKLAEAYDTMVKASEFVMSDPATTALTTWDGGKLHGHGLLCDSAIYVHTTHGFPLSDEVKDKLQAWNSAASKKIYDSR